MAVPGGGARARRCVASAPSPLRAARLAPPATPRVFPLDARSSRAPIARAGARVAELEGDRGAARDLPRADRAVGYPLADVGLQPFENGTAAGFARHDASFGIAGHLAG